ncbi:MAG: TetR/AcrR family transcriptional regulator [Sulfobacillus sp.]
MSPRSGRRPSGGDTRQLILDQARTAFSERGYDTTSLREIARLARVDPALVTHYFGSKDRLFAALMRLPDNLSAQVAALSAGSAADRGDRLVRFFLALWEDDITRQSLLAMFRSAVSNPQAADSLRGFISDALLGPLAAALDLPDPRLRAALAGSQLVGVAMVRYIVGVEPLASADLETVVAWIAPTLQRYLTA